MPHCDEFARASESRHTSNPKLANMSVSPEYGPLVFVKKVSSTVTLHSYFCSKLTFNFEISPGNRGCLRQFLGVEEEEEDTSANLPDMGAFLVMSFTNSCRVYTVHSQLRDVTEDLGLNSGVPALYAAATPEGVLIQVMEREILFVAPDLVSNGGMFAGGIHGNISPAVIYSNVYSHVVRVIYIGYLCRLLIGIHVQ